jgi:hypothetical protein
MAWACSCSLNTLSGVAMGGGSASREDQWSWVVGGSGQENERFIYIGM